MSDAQKSDLLDVRRRSRSHAWFPAPAISFNGLTLILTTRLGVRPLGVRGDPLHAVAGQLLSVIRRRLGDGPANLLAEPQLRESGDGIDWYASQGGDVRRFSDLSEAERGQAL